MPWSGIWLRSTVMSMGAIATSRSKFREDDSTLCPAYFQKEVEAALQLLLEKRGARRAWSKPLVHAEAPAAAYEGLQIDAALRSSCGRVQVAVEADGGSPCSCVL